MRIAVGADHGGFKAKQALVLHLRQAGHRVRDEGAHSPDPSDYPDLAGRVADRVSRGRASRGVLVCGTGIGMAIAANKVSGVRAATVWNDATARLAAEHNRANVLALGGRILTPGRVCRLVDLWLSTRFAGGRHRRRVKKITALERRRERSPRG